MSLQVLLPEPAAAPEGRLDYARSILRAEAAGLELVARRLDDGFLQAVDVLLRVTGDGAGRVAVTGTGKSADVGLKIAGTLNSTGARAISSTPRGPSTATSAWSILTTPCFCFPTAARAKRFCACWGRCGRWPRR